MASYSASKFGVIGFTQALAAEIARNGIRAYAVCPGPTNTDLHCSIVGKEAAEKAMSPERVAKEILAILTGSISVPTGSHVVIDETSPYLYRISWRNIWKKTLRKLLRPLSQRGRD
jgi:short-subunit dehydrogenase